MKRIQHALLLPALVALMWGATKLSPALAADTPAAADPVRAVVHVNFGDTERQKHGLKNITNILKETGEKGEIEVVAHGAGIDLLVTSKTKHAEQVAELRRRGVRFVACENTMREKSIAKGELLEGVETVPSGAVEVIRKQQAGYGYFRP